MPKIAPRARAALRTLAALLSSGLFVYLIWQAGPNNLWQNVVKLGWGFLSVLALAGVSHVVRAWAWRLTLDEHKHHTSFLRLLGLRLGAEAAGQLGIVGQTFGDAIRVSGLSPEIPISSGLASVTLDRGLYIATGILVLIAGLMSALPLLAHSRALHSYATLFVLALIFFLLAAVVALQKRWPFLSGSARLVARLPFLRKWVQSRYVLLQSVEHAILGFHHNSRGAFVGSFSLMLVSHLFAVTEICVVLWLMGVKFGVLSALVVEALTKLVNVLGNINPGNFGTFEGGTMLIGKMFGLSAATGLTLSLARRLRALFWTAVGGICLFTLTRSKRLGTASIRRSASDIQKKTAKNGADIPLGFRPENHWAVAIFLYKKRAVDREFEPGLASVGSLPILLRNILRAHKLQPSQLMVVVDPTVMPQLQHELSLTRRLSDSVQWVAAKADVSVQEGLQLIAARAMSDHLVVMDGSRTYHPSLLQRAKQSKDKSALVFSSGGKHVGIYALTANAVRDFQNSYTRHAGTFLEQLASLTKTHSADEVPVAEDLWQRVDTETDRQLAERKLNRWLVKPTDGFYARLNRKISVPISRLLIKFPVTANMVSIFTLAVGFASGAFFARGGYWNTLLGAFLCLLSSILDGCDGEVARLKIQESAFGCWLETVCDYVFYLILFVGMTLGLWRSSGSRIYLECGGLLLFGAIASFLATGWQRHRLAGKRPEQLLRIWQAHAEKRSSNLFLYFGRHTEFMVRRCFFPYALLFFALFNIMNVAFVLSAIGANLVWLIALYSSRVFAGPARSPANSTAHGWASKDAGNYEPSMS